MPKTTLIAIGEILVEFVSHQKGCELKRLAEYSGPYPSGAPAIFADQAALCGAQTMIIGSAGEDGFGEVLLNRLIRDGVTTDAVNRPKNRSTGVAFVSYKEDGSRNFIFHIENTAADAVEFSADQLPDGDLLLHLSGSSLGNPKLREAIRFAVDLVISKGGKISCDPNARPELLQDADAFKALKEIIAKSDILLPSIADIEFLYPDVEEQDLIAELLKEGVELIAIKRGDKGVSIITPDENFDLSPYGVTEIDPTGAGDCFCGTLLACYTQGMNIREAAQLANMAGALSVTRRGPMEGNSSLQRIREFLEMENSAI